MKQVTIDLSLLGPLSLAYMVRDLVEVDPASDVVKTLIQEMKLKLKHKDYVWHSLYSASIPAHTIGELLGLHF